MINRTSQLLLIVVYLSLFSCTENLDVETDNPLNIAKLNVVNENSFITIRTDSAQQKIEFMGGDIERAQGFIYRAANPDQIMQWCFDDIKFNICRVAYDKKQEERISSAFYVEGAVKQPDDVFSQWVLVPIANGNYHIKNNAARRHLQCTSELIDNGTANQIWANTDLGTGSWTQWQLIPIATGSEWFYLRNTGNNKKLQCTAAALETEGLHIRGADVSLTDNSVQWRAIETGTGTILLENREQAVYLRHTGINAKADITAYYENAVQAMKWIKEANPDIKFLATMKSDYNGFRQDNHNNLPISIYDYSCIESRNKTCLDWRGDRSFDTDKYGVFLADYVEHMYNNGVPISYLSTAKEWTQVVSAQRSHDTYVKLVSECNARGIPVPEIIGPATWSLSQGIAYTQDVISLGYQDEYHSLSSHNLNNQPHLYDDFVAAAGAAGKIGWNDETGYGAGGRTSGVDPDISFLINVYLEKIDYYEQGLYGECFFEITSRGINSETRAVYFRAGETGERKRSYYVMKEFANNVIGKNYVPSSVTTIPDVHTMAFQDDKELTIIAINNSDETYDSVPFNLSGANIKESIKVMEWTNSTVEGEKSKISDSITTTGFKTSLKSKSMNIFKLKYYKTKI